MTTGILGLIMNGASGPLHGNPEVSQYSRGSATQIRRLVLSRQTLTKTALSISLQAMTWWANATLK